MNRYAQRKDANHTPIVRDLQKQGIQVVDTSKTSTIGLTDIITFYDGKTVFQELKVDKDAKLKLSQVEFLSNWGGHCGIALNLDDAVKLAKMPEHYALRRNEKTKLAQLAVQMKIVRQKEIHLNTVLKLLNKQV